MSQLFMRFVYSLGGIGTAAVTVVAFVADIIGIVECFRNNEKHKKILWAFVACITLVATVGLLACRDLAEVPNVVEYNYEDATYKLTSCNLKYNHVIDKNAYVVKQSPVAGTIVKADTIVNLEVKHIGENEEAKETWENSLNTKYGDYSLNFYQVLAYLTDDTNIVKCFGTDITDPDIEYIYLIASDSGAEYHEYTLENGVATFRHIPQGITFKLFAKLKGYDLVEGEDVILSAEKLKDNCFKERFGLKKENADYGIASSFRVVDEKGKFLPEVDNIIKWDFSDIGDGIYRTDSNGVFEYTIWLLKNVKAQVTIMDPLKNGKEYSAEISLRKAISGKTLDSDIIIVNADGSCQVKKESEYFHY